MIPSEPIVFWQYFDVIVVSFVASVMLWLLVTHKNKVGDLLPSVSQTIAANKSSSLLFSWVMTVCVPLYYAFVWFWVGPLTSAPWYFYVIVALSFVSEMIFVWVPATSGRSKMIHEVAAGLVGVVMLIVPFMLLVAAKLSDSAAFSIELYLGASAALGVFLLISRLRKYTLHMEVVYCVMFWAVMSFIAHG